LHLAYHGVFEFKKTHSRFPSNNQEDGNAVVEIVKKIIKSNKATEGITVDELDEQVIKNVALYSAA
jgi:hypothetical protein